MSQKSASEPDPDESDAEPEFVEVDPSGRYGRYKEVLGKGAFKKVYRAFDEWEGIEVAWNQVKVTDLLRNSVDLDRLYAEVHLLKTLKHKNIIKFYHSWVDSKNEHINFITEIFTSGNLRQYRKKHKHVDVRALKKWSRQILEGLLYLHSHDPPVIHRDLKCDNIFVNGNQGEVKIGDLGLAAILEHARAAHSVIGTPEFMAPELYEEEYNELVDIYAFGMCLLELVTLEYPYVECANAAQIYKKVTAGIKPASLGKVKDPSVRTFIEKCIAKVSDRLSAEELLMDPFLQSGDESIRRCSLQPQSMKADDNDDQLDPEKTPEDTLLEGGRDFTVEGQRKDNNTIFLTLRIADSSGYIRNIHFPFDIEVDTSFNVASEMVQELDLTDHDVSVIAAIIDAEIQSHIPSWEPRQIETINGSTKEEILESGVKAQDNSSDTADVPFWSDSYKTNDEISLLDELVMSVDSSSEDTNSTDFSNSNDYRKQEIMSVPSDIDTSANKPLPAEEDGVNSDIKSLIEKLDHVLDEQQHELKELRTKHERALSNILKELPQDIRETVVRICTRKRSDEKKHRVTKSLNLSSSLINIIRRGRRLGQCIRGPVCRSCFNSIKKNGKSELGISVVFKDDKMKA